MSICLRHRRRHICANSVPVFCTFLIKYLLFLQVSSASQAKNIFPNDAKFFTVILEHLNFHSGTKNLPILFHVIDTLKTLVKLLAEIGANRVPRRKQNTVILPAGTVFQTHPACICFIKTAINSQHN